MTFAYFVSKQKMRRSLILEFSVSHVRFFSALQGTQTTSVITFKCRYREKSTSDALSVLTIYCSFFSCLSSRSEMQQRPVLTQFYITAHVKGRLVKSRGILIAFRTCVPTVKVQ